MKTLKCAFLQKVAPQNVCKNVLLITIEYVSTMMPVDQ